MLHMFLKKGDWFAPKRYGYGAGLPIAWQGWALLAAYCAGITGAGLLAQNGAPAERTAAFALVLVLTALLIAIAARRTRGRWKWRWGERD
ncbi:hypothetical protein [Novosphingobium malaysiense]|uniref:Uncharacterized protein n=1 Tax=Novosphingobium malaysiense TaxID=1348853 RepID=A0A0B1ZPN3_9SPHN|nr:hypothetical protein [Novosphingobium malaysiense]KHK92551.1 hypothetical protein LK12_07165 [Novosphingobium malaysiense]